MSATSCCYVVPKQRPKLTRWALAFCASTLLASTAQAASFGHARLLSAQAQPLQLQVPVRQLSQQDVQSLSVSIPAIERWRTAGLTPPVALSSLRVQVLPGPDSRSRVLRISSSQPFHGNTADLLLDIHTDSGAQPYQVSVLSSQPLQVALPGASSSAKAAHTGSSAQAAGSTVITVKAGDTLWSLATANAIPGASVFQVLHALYQANPNAFIKGNINGLKAGAQLTVPDRAAVMATSATHARQFFQQQMQAFRQGSASVPVPGATNAAQAPAAGSGLTTPPSSQNTPGNQHNTVVTHATPTQDQLVLSASSGQSAEGSALAAGAAADEALATQQNINEADSRISQLERNVKSVNEALQSQGKAASDAVLEGARSLGQSIAEITGTATDAAGDAIPASTEDHARQGATPDTTGSSSDASSPALKDQSPASNSSHPETGGGNNAGSSASASADPVSKQTADAARASTATPAEAPAQASLATQPETTKHTMQSGNWVQNNLLILISGILALIVLIVAWVLRRANASSTTPQQPITEAMVKEQLEKINLDLQHSEPADPAPPHR